MCIFCKIARHEIPANIVYEDDTVMAFRDIHPQAPVHILIIPKEHIPTVNDLTEKNAGLISHMILVAKKIARDVGIDKSGYRILINCNKDAGQEIFHLHLHLLGGKPLGPMVCA